jgi:UDP-N-acetylmuramoyl-L-alanyl-D-glutamate--2,6-diaminopimelate ligase
MTGAGRRQPRVRPGACSPRCPGSRMPTAQFIPTRLRMGAGAILTDAEGARLAAAEIARDLAVAPVIVAEDPRQALA